MADEIKVKFSGETKSYSTEIKNLIQQNKTLAAEYKAVQSNTDKATSSDQKAAQMQTVLSKQIQARAETIKAMTAKYNQFSDEEKKSSKEALELEASINKQQEALNKAKGQLDGTAASTNKLVTATDAMLARKEIAAVYNKIADSVANLGKKGLQSVIGITGDFDTSMSKVKALSGATGDEFEKLRKKARDMGATTKYSAGESADALSYMALAGWDTNEMLEGLDGVLDLAAASGMELAEASDIVTDFLSAFGKEAKDAGKMADMMAYAQAHSNTTTRQLGEAFRNSAANMNTAGQSMETTTALLEAMANQGNKGSEAGTALAAMMRDLTQKMKDGNIYIGETAVQVMDASGNFRNMIDILADVDAATQGMGTAQKSAALMTTFTARSVKGVNQVLNEGVESLYQYAAELQTADGAAGSMAETMQDNLEGQLTILKSQLQELAISVGDELMPYIRKGVEVLQNVTDKINALSPGAKKLLAVMLSGATAAAVIVPKFAALYNTLKQLQSARKVVSLFDKMYGSMDKASTGAGKLWKTLGQAGKTAGIVGAVVGAAAALNKAITDWQLKGNEAYQTSKRLTEGFKSVAEAARDAKAEIEAIETNAAAEAKQIQNLTSRLTDLNNRQNLTTSEQAEYKRIVQELAALLPGFSSEIDTSTGKLANQAQVSQEAIDALADTKRATDAYSRLNQLVADQAQRQTELIAAQELAKEWADKLGVSVDELREQYGGAQTTMGKLGDKMTDWFGNAAQKEMVQYGTEIRTIFEEIDALEGASEAASKEIDNLNEVIGDAPPEMNKAEDAADDLGDAALDMADDIEDAADDVEDSFEDIYNAAKKDLQKTLNILDEWADEGGNSMDDFAEVMRKNAVAWAKWDSNVKTLTSDARYQSDANFRALVDSLILMEGKGAVAMDQFATAVENGDDRAVASWVEAADAAETEKDKVTTTLATMQAEAKVAEDQIAKDASTGATNYKAAAQKYVSHSEEVRAGMRKKMDDIVGISKSMPTEMSKAITAGAGQPSAAMKSLTDGIKRNFPVKADAYSSAEAVDTAIQQALLAGNPKVLKAAMVVQASSKNANPDAKGAYAAGQNVPDQVAAGMNANANKVTGAGNTIKTNATSSLQGTGNAYKWGAELGDAYAAGIASKNDAIKRQSIKLANAASSALHFSIPDIGPLRKIGEWGPELAQAYAKGMESAKSIATIEHASEVLAGAIAPNIGAAETVIYSQNQNIIDYGAIYDAVSAAMAEHKTSLVIGNREFGRILREATA